MQKVPHLKVKSKINNKVIISFKFDVNISCVNLQNFQMQEKGMNYHFYFFAKHKWHKVGK